MKRSGILFAAGVAILYLVNMGAVCSAQIGPAPSCWEEVESPPFCEDFDQTATDCGVCEKSIENGVEVWECSTPTHNELQSHFEIPAVRSSFTGLDQVEFVEIACVTQQTCECIELGGVWVCHTSQSEGLGPAITTRTGTMPTGDDCPDQ